MKKDIKFYENEILNSIFKIERYIKNMSLWDFYDDEKTYDACCMQLQHIWECGIKLLNLTSKDYKNIPFKKMSAFRNRISHDYIWLDEKIIWITIKESLPELKKIFEN